MTEWRPVVGFEGLYEVSESGNVRSLDRLDSRGNQIKGKKLTQCLVGPRWAVTLYREGKRYHGPIHRLVLEAFVGPRPDGYDACHNDGDRDNNHISNLRWDTRSANTLDQVQHGTHREARKTKCPLGHLYIEANCLRRPSRPHERECKSCATARNRLYSAKKYGRSYDFNKGADEIYAELQSGVTL